MLVLSLITVALAAPPRVKLPCGDVEGSWLDEHASLTAFRGIPYGKPPVGNLRWNPPHPAYTAPNDCWNGTLGATKFGSVCHQLNPWFSAHESEDCLSLNVYSRAGSAKKLPIIFWIHGGSNVAGSSGAYDGIENLPALMDHTCMIAPNFRLGVFGFLALRELSAQDPRGTSGNYAITDLQLALHWVQQYASHFGCDPTNVTLLGQSSGGTNIFTLLSSNKNRGLFHRAIALSGSLNITQNLHSAEVQGAAYAASTSCKGQTGANLLTCLRKLPASAIITPDPWGSTDFWPTNPSGLPNPGLTIVDGVTVQMPFDVALSNNLVDVPLLLQSTRSELEIFDAAAPVSKMTPAQFQDYLTSNFKPWSATTGKTLYDQYSKVAQTEGVATADYDLMGDINNVCAHILIANTSAHNAHTKRVHPLYVTIFERPPAHMMCNFTLAFHCLDFIFAAHGWKFFCETAYKPVDTDLSIGVTLREMWLSLAIEGHIPGLRAINQAQGGSYNVGLIGTPGKAAVVNVPDAHAERCSTLKRLGLLPDSRFWWVN